jgi:hypothetical protein
MRSVSVRLFRSVCVVALASLLLVQLQVVGLVSLSSGVATARMWKYYEALAPWWLTWVYGIAEFALLLVGLVGMLNFWRFSRWCVLLALALGLCVRPFLGLAVYSAYEASLGGLSGIVCTWLVSISFWSPFAERFTERSGVSPNNRWRGP